MAGLQQMDIGPDYRALTMEETMERIARRKEELGERLLILGHHYQADGVFRFADLRGDSLKLSREAAAIQDREFLVFCGVHFMAEAGDILGAPHQKVLLPHLDAGCPMAEMASGAAIDAAWRELVALCGCEDSEVTPITYVNSSAEVKAFVGRHGGSVCTSSNARAVLAWALEQGEKVFFFPDEHLGRNAAWMLNLPGEQVVVWHRGEPGGGNEARVLKKARVILWDGYCEVHMRIFPEHLSAWRGRDSRARIIVHPECRNEVVRAADLYGSTEAIIQAVREAEPGSTWVVGTEINLVQRLAREYPDRSVHPLTDGCLCPTMAAVSPAHLLWVLDNLAQGRVVNRIRVDPAVAEQARLALDRMLAI